MREEKNVGLTPKHEKPKSLRSKTTSEISLLANKNQFKDIYNGTRDYLVELVKKK